MMSSPAAKSALMFYATELQRNSGGSPQTLHPHRQLGTTSTNQRGLNPPPPRLVEQDLPLAGEENLVMEDDKHYPHENILVHEFAHSVMAVGMNEDQRQVHASGPCLWQWLFLRSTCGQA